MSRSTLSPVIHGDLRPMLALIERLARLVERVAPSHLVEEAEDIRVDATRLANTNRALPLPHAVSADLEAMVAHYEPVTPEGPTP